MSFSQMAEILRKKHSGKIVLVRLGAFYIAMEEEGSICDYSYFNYASNDKCKYSIWKIACIHELAHLFTGILLGFNPQELKISPIGLQVSFKIKYEEYNNKIIKGNSLAIKKAIIAAAGPIINLIIATMAILVLNNTGEIIQVFNTNITIDTLIYANILIAFFNLIPIYPLDGGRILHEILHIIIGLKKAYTYTHIISKITIIILTVITSITILYLHNIAIIIILAYLWLLIIRESRIYHNRTRINKIEEIINKEKCHL